MKDNQEVILNLKHFRDVSIYFYMTSFFMITIMFIFYLVGSKNNRSCQYGSTLHCNTEKFYYSNLNKGESYLELVFNQPESMTAGTCFTLGFPYDPTNYYNIDYYFGVAGGATVTDIFTTDNTNIGISFNGTIGGSIYFNNTSRPEAVTLNKITEFVLLNNDISTIKIFAPTAKTANDATLDYDYVRSQDGIIAFTHPTISTANSFFTYEQKQYDASDPVKSNWITLLDNNKKQHKYGCSPGYLLGCACVDPNFETSLICNDYILNEDYGLYCPPQWLGCSKPCSGDVSGENNCGYRFCSNGILSTTATKPDGSTNTRQNYGDKSTYQNAFIPGIKPEDIGENAYTVGYKGESLAANLGLTGTWNKSQLSDVAQVQLRSMCAGETAFDTNNVNDSATRTGNVALPGSLGTNSYTAQFSKYPNFANDTFDF
jgi:hypothetical protein